jgi:hypothetical protein
MNLPNRCYLIVLITSMFATPLLLNSQPAFSTSGTVDTTQPVPSPKPPKNDCKPKPGPFIDPFCPGVPIPPPPKDDCKPKPGPFIDPFCPKLPSPTQP